MPKIEKEKAKVRKVKRPSEVKGLVDIETRPRTLQDILAQMVPPKTVHTIRGGHLLRGFHEINRIGYKESERLVAEALRAQDRQRIDRTSRIYMALSQVQAALNEATAQKEKAQKMTEELQSTNEEMKATNEELQATTEELEESSRYSRNLIEANMDPLVTIGRDGKITDVNTATEKVTGFSKKELVGKDFSDYFTNPKKAREGYKKVFRKGFVRNYALEIKSKDKHITPVLYNASVYRDKRGKVAGVFAAARDITEQKKASEKMQKLNEEMQATNEEMEASNEELRATTEELQRTGEQMQQFASVASHELQEPLRMVTSYLQLIEKRYKAKLDKKGKEFMAFAVDGAKRMQTLVNDLLTYSRVSTRAKPFEQTNFEDVLNQVLSDMQVTIKKNRAMVTHDRLPAVIADKEQIGQLLQNLINNSIKFRKKKARSRIHISAKQKGREWIFSVRDNGIGISPQHKDKIFQIFQRLHAQKEYHGTGIGLAVCKNIVQRHGGRIWIKSKPGKGATFYFTIPVRKKKEEEARRKKADERWQKAKEDRSRTPETETKKAKKKKRR